MQTQCKKCFALPFADIMIIAHLYLLCLAFAEEQGSAMPEMVPAHIERGAAGKVTLPRSFQTYCHTSSNLSSRAALWRSPELNQPCEPRKKTLLAAVPQHNLLPTRVVLHVLEGASSAPIPVGGTACAYFHAAIILAAGPDKALQQLEHPILLMCTGAFSSAWVI